MLQTGEVSSKSPKQKFISQTPTLRRYTHPEAAVRTRQLANLRLIAHIAQTLHDGRHPAACGHRQWPGYADQLPLRQARLEATSLQHDLPRQEPGKPQVPMQSDLFASAPHPLLEQLDKINPDDLTPRKALELLYTWKTQI